MRTLVVGPDTTRVLQLCRQLDLAGVEVSRGGVLSALRSRSSICIAASPIGLRAGLGLLALRVLGGKVIVDHFIPLHEKYIEDQRRWSPRSAKALALRLADVAMCWVGTRTSVDTDEHADHLAGFSRRPRNRFAVLPAAAPLVIEQQTAGAPPVDVFWIGTATTTFHGGDVVRGAISQLLATRSDLTAVVTTSMPSPEAASTLARSRVALGVFGGSPKGDRVVPFKVLDALAFGVPVVTLSTPAVVRAIGRDGGAVLVDDPTEETVARTIAELLDDPARCEAVGAAGRRSYARCFSDEAQAARLPAILASL